VGFFSSIFGRRDKDETTLSCDTAQPSLDTLLRARDEYDDGLNSFFQTNHGMAYSNDPVGIIQRMTELHPVMSSCVRLIRAGVASLPFEAIDTKDAVLKRKQIFLIESLNNPSFNESKHTFLRKITWHLLVKGECLLKVTLKKHQYVFEILSTAWALDLNKDTGQIEGFTNGEVKIPYQTAISHKIDMPFAMRIQLGDFGVGYTDKPLKAAFKSAGVSLKVFDNLENILENRPSTSGIFVAETTDAYQPSAEAWKAFEVGLKKLSRAGGGLGQGRILPTTINGKILNLNPSLDQALSPETRAASLEDICIALGIGKEIIGLGESKYANKQAAMVAFVNNTLISTYGNAILDAFNNAFFDWSLGIFINERKIEALRRDGATAMQTLNKVEFLTQDEKREEYNYAPTNGTQNEQK
jgi:phage portal protein BeeE